MNDPFTDKLGIFEIQSGLIVMHCDCLALKAIPSCLPIQPHVSSIVCRPNTEHDKSNRSSAYIIQPS